MYLTYYNFEKEPFALAPDADFIFLGSAHKKALNYLKYALWNKDSFTLISGAIGAGKTILLQCLLKTLPDSILVIAINQTQLSPIEFLEMLIDHLGLTRPQYPSKPNLYKLLHNYFESLDKQSVVFIVDEAQGMPLETFEELRCLVTNDFDGGEIDMNIIFCGQPELRDMIESPQLNQLNQRIRLKFELDGLTSKETTDYINYRLMKAGRKVDLFSLNALNKIYHYTKGVPRNINKLCDTALICGFAGDSNTITTKHIEEAIKELQWLKPKRKIIENKKEDLVEDDIIRLKPAISESATIEKALAKYLKNIDIHLSKIVISLDVLARSKE